MNTIRRTRSPNGKRRRIIRKHVTNQEETYDDYLTKRYRRRGPP